MGLLIFTEIGMITKSDLVLLMVNSGLEMIKYIELYLSEDIPFDLIYKPGKELQDTLNIQHSVLVTKTLNTSLVLRDIQASRNITGSLLPYSAI